MPRTSPQYGIGVALDWNKCRQGSGSYQTKSGPFPSGKCGNNSFVASIRAVPWPSPAHWHAVVPPFAADFTSAGTPCRANMSRISFQEGPSEPQLSPTTSFQGSKQNERVNDKERVAVSEGTTRHTVGTAMAYVTGTRTRAYHCFVASCCGHAIRKCEYAEEKHYD